MKKSFPPRAAECRYTQITNIKLRNFEIVQLDTVGNCFIFILLLSFLVLCAFFCLLNAKDSTRILIKIVVIFAVYARVC